MRTKRSLKTQVLFLLWILGRTIISANGQVTVDGTLNYSEGYGSPLASQTINTGFGDNTSDTSGNSSGGSELDAVYGVVYNGVIYLFMSGNLEANGNNI